MTLALGRSETFVILRRSEMIVEAIFKLPSFNCQVVYEYERVQFAVIWSHDNKTVKSKMEF